MAKVVNTRQHLAVWSQALVLAPKFLDHVNAAAMLTVGGLAIMDGHFSIGALLAFQSLMTAFMSPFSTLAGLGGELQTARGEINRLDDVMRARLDPVWSDSIEEKAAPGVEKLRGLLEIRNLTFGYAKQEPPFLQEINLTLEPGKRVALVGASGSGKSTLANLVAGLLEPWSGEILFDGKPRREWPRSLLASSLAHVSQDIYLFEGTIAQNIALFDPEVPIARIEQAARDAAKKIENHKTTRAENPLEDVSREPQAQHVHQQVKQTRMDELVGDELPDHALSQSTLTQPEDAVCEVGKRWRDAHQDKDENIGCDQRFDGGDIESAITLKHHGNLLAGGGLVDGRPDSHSPAHTAHHGTGHGPSFLGTGCQDFFDPRHKTNRSAA